MERAMGLVGVVCLVAIAFALSTNRKAVQWRPVGIALGIQLAIALLVLRTPFGASFFAWVNDGAAAFIGAANVGIEFVFGAWPESVLGPDGQALRLPYVFAIRVLPILVFMSSVFAVLQHFGILQRVVEVLARGLRRSLRTSGAESLAAIAEVFLGMTEAPLMIRPYVAGLTRSELFCVMTAGLATVAGTVLVAYMGMLGPEYAGHLVAASFMAAPAAVAVAKLMVPEEGEPQTRALAHVALPRTTVNAIDAAATGAADGVRLALNIGGMLVAFVALVHVANAGLGWAGALVGISELSFERILGVLLAPLAFVLGVPWHDAARIGEMLGVKTILNEFIAYQMLAEAKATLDPRSIVIASYALCGFANLGSLAIQIGGLGGIAPERRGDVARDAMRALVAGSLASFMTAAIAGMVY
ncbi:MAG: nucleoside transporter C-terminal domain-containing protein [Myxococcota bacterium]